MTVQPVQIAVTVRHFQGLAVEQRNLAKRVASGPRRLKTSFPPHSEVLIRTRTR